MHPAKRVAVKSLIVKWKRLGVSLAVLLSTPLAARAQVPLPTPKPLTSATRQRLRAAILQVAATSRPDDFARANLTLPLAELGDWKGAFQLLRGDSMAVQHASELWRWRAYQLARAGKWIEAADAAGQIQLPAAHADALLFIARCMVDRNIALGSPTGDSKELERILFCATPLLAQGARLDQKAYDGYLWARGEDVVAAKRVFDRAYLDEAREAAKIAAAKKRGSRDPSIDLREMYNRPEVVLTWEAHAGLFSDAIQHLGSLNNPIAIDNLVAAARGPADFEAMDKVLAGMPNDLRARFTYELAMVCGLCGYRTEGLARFEQAGKIPSAANESGTRWADPTLVKIMAFEAAHVLRAGPLETSAEADLRAAMSSAAGQKTGMRDDFDCIAPFMDLEVAAQVGLPPVPPTPVQLDEIAAQLAAAKPSDLRFRMLQNVAAYYFKRKQRDKVLAMAGIMLKTARALAANETAALQRNSGLISPYWPQSPRLVTVIFWFQRAGEASTAATLAQEFARTVTSREKPYASMLLLQVGFPRLARTLFDPLVEIPRYAARRKADWKRKYVDWTLFSDWPGYAVTETVSSGAEAPFRWYGALPDAVSRSQVLAAMVAALYPQPAQQRPYVSVSALGESASAY